MRILDSQAVEDIAMGGAVMASGGGGNPYMGILIAKQMVEQYGGVKLVSVDEIADDARVFVSMGLGAPTVLVEKVPAGPEPVWALEELEAEIGHDFDYVMASEAGGWNSLHPMLPAAQRGMPLLDADGMGRAFPELQMVTWSVYGQSAQPIGVADERGNRMCIRTSDNKRGEDLGRGITVEIGGNSSMACYPMTGAEAKAHSVLGTYTLLERIGQLLRDIRKREPGAKEELMETIHGVELFRGKVQDVERRTVGGFARGVAHLEGFDDYKGSNFVMRFQNEYLIGEVDGRVVCTAPDLISLFDTETYTPITSEALKYGCRAIVVGIPCAHQWRTPEGLAVAGPRVFGYDLDYIPVEERNA